MDSHVGRQDNLWESITTQLRATIAKMPVKYGTSWLHRAFEQNEREGSSMAEENSSGQPGGSAKHSESSIISHTSRRLFQATGSAADEGKDAAVTPIAEAGLHSLNNSSRSLQGAQSQYTDKGDIRSSPTSAYQESMAHSTSSTTTRFESPVHSTTKLGENLRRRSSTPPTATKSDAIEEASPASTIADTNVQSPKRKISFKMLLSGDEEEEVEMPPSKLRRTLNRNENQIVSRSMDREAAAAYREVTFEDISGASANDKKASKLTVPVELSGSSRVNIDANTQSYAEGDDGLFTEAPLHHTKSLREAVDPAFHNDLYSGDNLYVRPERECSLHCDRSNDRGFHRSDWQIISDALNRSADERIPLPDTSTISWPTKEQLHNIWLSFKGACTETAIIQAQVLRKWTAVQVDKSGVRWTGMRSSYDRHAPEFCVVSSQDICKDPEFSTFCTFAQFDNGRQGAMPSGLELQDTLAVLSYARQTVQSSREVDGHHQQQIKPLAQPRSSTVAARLRHDALTSGSQLLSAARADMSLSQASLQQPQHSQGVATPAQLSMVMVRAAFRDFGVFMTLSPEALGGMGQQWTQRYAQEYVSRGLSIPNSIPTPFQVWQYFRQAVKAKTRPHRRRSAREKAARKTAAREMAARETAAREEAQASMVRNPFIRQASTPILNRPVQLSSHMPSTPGSQLRVCVNSASTLGSPFQTSGSMRDENIDPRLY